MKTGWFLGSVLGFLLFLVLGMNGIGNFYYTVPIGIVVFGLLGRWIEKYIKTRIRKKESS